MFPPGAVVIVTKRVREERWGEKDVGQHYKME